MLRARPIRLQHPWRIISSPSPADFCVGASKETTMHFHFQFFLGIGLVLLIMGLCYFYNKEN
jgi:hypothetical protein